MQNIQISQNELQTRQAFKTAIAVIICTWILNWFHFAGLAFIAPVSAFVLMVMFQNQTFGKGLQRIIGPAIFTIVAIIMMRWTHLWILYVFFVFAMFMFGGYLFAMERFAYAGLMGAIIGSIVFIEGFIDIHAANELGMHFVGQCALGVVVAWLVTWIVYPIKPETHFIPKLALAYKELTLQWQQQEKISVDSFAGLIPRYKACQKSFSRSQKALYQHLTIDAKMFYLKNDHTIKRFKEIQKTAVYSLFSSEFEQVVSSLQQLYQDQADAIAQYKQTTLSSPAFELAIENLEKHINDMREQEAFAQYPMLDVLNLLSVLHEIKLLGLVISRMAEKYNAELFENRDAKALKTFIEEEKHHLLPLNTNGLKRAFKIALAAMVMMFTHYYWGWFGGIQAVITTVIVVAQPNLGLSQHKLILRFLGIVLGGVAAILALMLLAHATSFAVYLGLLFIVTVVCAYYAQGSDRYAYIAVQAAIIFYLVLLTTLGPSNNMNIAVDRFIGVLQGGLIGYLITYFVFPTNPLTLIKNKLISGFEQCADIYKNLDAIEHKKLREVIAKTLNGNKQLMVDLKDWQLMGEHADLFNTNNALTSCLEQLLIFTERHEKIIASPLCQRIRPMISDELAQFPQVFIDTANLLKKKEIDETRLPNLMKSFLTKIEEIRKQKLTKQSSLTEVQLFTVFIDGNYYLLQRLQQVQALYLTSAMQADVDDALLDAAV